MKHRFHLSRLAAALLVVALFLCALPTAAPPAAAVSATLVISQFQVVGDSPAGSSADEFVELHNVSGGPVDLNGHILVYRAATGIADVSTVLKSWAVSTIDTSRRLLPVATSAYNELVPPDATLTAGATGALAASGGGIALRNGPPNIGMIVDSVGYGTATNAFVEGATIRAPGSNDSRRT